MRASALLVLVAACGRYDFDALRDGATSDTSDATSDRPNRAFVLGSFVPPTFGSAAGADALCQAEADAHQLNGTFLALIADATTNALDRFAGSRGWVRMDGEPTFDQITDLRIDRMFNPLNRDITGQLVSDMTVWTGSDFSGGVAATCQGWTSASGSDQGSTGNNAYLGTGLLSWSPTGCSAPVVRLYCLEVGHQAVVAPHPISGRYLFVSATVGLPTGGIGALDTLCQSDAMAANLPGTYRAAVATTTTTIQSRFTLDARPWIRIDGTRVAGGGDALFTMQPDSFADQDSSGAYGASFYFTGAVNPQNVGSATCMDWTYNGNSLAGATGNSGRASSTAPNMWTTLGSASCNYAMGVLCLQE